MICLRVILAALILPLCLDAALAEGWPRQIESSGQSVTIAQQPKRIASTSPSLTGILLAIDAPLVATAASVKGPLTDEEGYFLQWAEIAHQRGVGLLYPNMAFDLESLLVTDPDLVIVSATGGDSIIDHVDTLKSMGFNVLVVDYSDQSWQDQAEILGQALGLEENTEKLLARFAARTQDVKDQITRPEGKISILSYNMAGTYAVSKPISAQAQLLAQLGFITIGLPEEMASLVTRAGDFDFVSLENLAPAIKGDSIFLLSGTEASVAAVLADPVLAHLPAVKERRVYPLGPTSFRVDYYSGSHIIDLMQKIFSTP